ncbi:MAG: hypothetical protein ACFE8N_08195 [Promethearchaeota archaeon]
MPNEIKALEDLENEIIKIKKCCACGACIANCDCQEFNGIEIIGQKARIINRNSYNLLFYNFLKTHAVG